MTEQKYALGHDLVQRQVLSSDQLIHMIGEASQTDFETGVLLFEDFSIEDGCFLSSKLLSDLSIAEIHFRTTTFRQGLFIKGRGATVCVESCESPEVGISDAVEAISVIDCRFGKLELFEGKNVELQLRDAHVRHVVLGGSIRSTHRDGFSLTCDVLDWQVTELSSVNSGTPLIDMEGIRVREKIRTNSVTWAKYFQLSHPNIPIIYTGPLKDLG